jgi:enolase
MKISHNDRVIRIRDMKDMLNKENMNMNTELFNKIDYDVENGYSKKECIEKWGKDVIKEYEKFGVENDLFETDLEEWEEWNEK